MNSLKKNDPSSTESSTAMETSSRTMKLAKPVKVPSLTKDMSLETYAKQIATWTDLNEDVPENAKYHDLIEELKRNTAIKGIHKYVADHILPTLIQKTDKTLEKVVQILDKKYGRSRTEKVEEAVKEIMKFRE